jgi:HSP20 family protein
MVLALFGSHQTREEEAMLMRTDPFRDFDRLTEAVLGTRARPAMMPIDAYREDGTFVVHLDLPGMSMDSIDLTVEQNVLTVHAERKPPVGESAERVVDERSYGVFSRQLFLGDTLDTDQLSASYEAGVLTLTIPIAEKAKPRKVEITGGGTDRREINA